MPQLFYDKLFTKNILPQYAGHMAPTFGSDCSKIFHTSKIHKERPLLMGSGINHTRDTSASHVGFGMEGALVVAVQSSLEVNIIPTGRVM